MPSEFLLYGATGFVGEAIARQAVAEGLSPTLAGRDPIRVAARADELHVDHRAFPLDHPEALDAALAGVPLVLNCAGPFRQTAAAVVAGCLRTGTHYLDITGELPVFAGIAEHDVEAADLGVMLLPGVGFDVVATDCLAVHLKERLPSATRLTLAFHIDGPALLPPGTVRTMTERRPGGVRVRVDGEVATLPGEVKTRKIDFGMGPVTARRQSWGDVFTAYWSTGIPNIETYSVWSRDVRRQVGMAAYARRNASAFGPAERWPRPSTSGERAQTRTSVWGEALDGEGRRAVARLHGPEAGVVWTADAALAVVRHVLAGDAAPGFQTPASAYGADLVLESEGVMREDLE